MPKSNRNCCAVNCHNTQKNTHGKGITYHRFPGRPWESDRRRKWILAVGRINADGTPWEPNKCSVVCSEHFVGGKPSNIENHPSYIPSVFHDSCKRKCEVSHFERVRKRMKCLSIHMPSDHETCEFVVQNESGKVHKSVQAAFGVEATTSEFTCVFSGNDVGTQCNVSTAPPSISEMVDKSCGPDHPLDIFRRFHGYQTIKSLKLMEMSEYIKCETEHLSDVEESSTYEPDNMPCEIIESDGISPEPDIKEDISRLIKEEPLTEEICIKSHPDEALAVKVEQGVTTMILREDEKEISCSESYEGSGRDMHGGVKDEVDDISGSLKNETRSPGDVMAELSVSSQQGDSPVIHNSSHKTTELSSVHSNVNIYTCHTCSKDFGCRSSLAYHQRTHSNERPYICSECNRGFKQRKTLLGHMATHSNIKAHTCSKCFRAFRTKSDLKRHMASHSTEKPFNCNRCGQRFKGRSAIRLHLLIHTNVKLHTCTNCYKDFRTKSALDFHMRTHSDQRPYTCDGCGQGFKTRQHIIRHFYRNGKSYNCHNNVQTFACSSCFKPFRSKLSLSIHMRIHIPVTNVVRDS